MNEKLMDMVIRTRVDEFDIEIRINNLSELEDAYLSLLEARREFRGIQEKHRLLTLADSSRVAASSYWVLSSENKRTLNIEDRANGIMLSLLDSYPNTKPVKDIVAETGYPQSSVSEYLNGVTGNVGSCFLKEEGGWNLTPEGLNSIARFLNTLDDTDEANN